MSERNSIAKNSLYLYLRMAVMMVISLYTSRVILKNLGVVDFGILNVVGGIAVIFSFFNNALTNSSQRFITVSLCKDTIENARKVYSMSINCHLIIAIIILLLSETIGLWFMNSELNIPSSRMGEANIVYQCSLLSCIIGVISAPLSGAITAHERMSFYAITSILSAILKLAIAFIIAYCEVRKLTIYSLLLLGISFISLLVNYFYCRIQFDICRYVKSTSKKLFHEIVSFTGWNMFKMGAIIGVAQGNNILVNIYGGTIASAAISIANQINGTLYSFTQSTQTAFKPQITKTVAVGQINQSLNLIQMCARITFMLICFVAAPLLLQMTSVLHLWLTQVPPDTSTLSCFCIISVMLDIFCEPLNTAIFARGNIRTYQIVTSIFWAIAIPLAWILLKVDIPFRFILLSKIAAQFCILTYSLLYLRRVFHLAIFTYLYKTLLKPALIFIIVIYIGHYISNLLQYPPMLAIISTTLITSGLLSLGFFTFILEKEEKQIVYKIFRNRFIKNNEK